MKSHVEPGLSPAFPVHSAGQGRESNRRPVVYCETHSLKRERYRYRIVSGSLFPRSSNRRTRRGRKEEYVSRCHFLFYPLFSSQPASLSRAKWSGDSASISRVLVLVQTHHRRAITCTRAIDHASHQDLSDLSTVKETERGRGESVVATRNRRNCRVGSRSGQVDSRSQSLDLRPPPSALTPGAREAHHHLLPSSSLPTTHSLTQHTHPLPLLSKARSSRTLHTPPSSSAPEPSTHPIPP